MVFQQRTLLIESVCVCGGGGCVNGEVCVCVYVLNVHLQVCVCVSIRFCTGPIVWGGGGGLAAAIADIYMYTGTRTDTVDV